MRPACGDTGGPFAFVVRTDAPYTVIPARRFSTAEGLVKPE
jgi:hypothetical protein